MQLSDMVELARGGNGFEVVPGEVDLLPQEHSYLTRKKRKTRKNIKLKQQIYIVNPPPPPISSILKKIITDKKRKKKKKT
jgi:hypothetical protein